MRTHTVTHTQSHTHTHTHTVTHTFTFICQKNKSFAGAHEGQDSAGEERARVGGRKTGKDGVLPKVVDKMQVVWFVNSCDWVFGLPVSACWIAQWLERQIRDQKVAGLNPCWSGGRIFFSRVNFLCWLLFRYPFHPSVTAVTHKRSRSSCQKCRWQVTARHTYTLRMWLCMKWHGAWLYGGHRMRWDGSRFMWHQPCQCCKYTLQWIFKNVL